MKTKRSLIGLLPALLVLVGIGLTWFSCNRNCTMTSSVVVAPFEFTLSEKKDSVLAYFKRRDVFLYYDDSYYLNERNVIYYEFGYNEQQDSVRYFAELFFISDELNGVRVKFYNAPSETVLQKKVNEYIMPSFRKSIQDKECVIVDTIKAKDEYTIYFRSKKLDWRARWP